MGVRRPWTTEKLGLGCLPLTPPRAPSPDHTGLTQAQLAMGIPWGNLTGLCPWFLGGDRQVLYVLGIFQVIECWFYSWWVPQNVPEFMLMRWPKMGLAMPECHPYDWAGSEPGDGILTFEEPWGGWRLSSCTWPTIQSLTPKSWNPNKNCGHQAWAICCCCQEGNTSLTRPRHLSVLLVWLCVLLRW